MQVKPAQMLKSQQLRSVFDLAQSYESLQGRNAACLKRIFQITAKTATCKVGAELSAKYNVQQENQQLVVSFTNRYTLEQTWFNEARTQKPQTFSQGSEFLDPTDNGASCDFCNWRVLTAQDPGFGRIELPHAVTGSNLFKYAEPSHGIVLFKHHNPLHFTQEQLSDLLDASWLWCQASHKLNPHAVEPFFLWNCLPRAGASQYHGHAQVMLTEEPVPFIMRLQQAAAAYQQEHSSDYYADVLRAHDAAGLLRQISIPADNLSRSSTGSSSKPAVHTAWGYASLSPYKDMEVTVMGSHICCHAFQRMLHAALRAMIDTCGCRTFNVGVLNMDIATEPPAGAGKDRQYWNSSSSSAISVEVNGAGSSTSSSTASLSAMSTSSSSGSSNTNSSDGSSTPNWQYSGGSTPGSGKVVVPDTWPWGDRPPIVARLVSRGKLSSVASDFGCLEVFGGASIGHTDPFLVVQALEDQLGGLGRVQ